MSNSGRGRPDGRSEGLGAIAGVLAAGAALGVGQFVAGLTGASGSPVVVVGELQIDFTPPWLKNFAITDFGADDKLVLVGGILVVLGLFAAIIGAAAIRRMAYGMAGLAVFAAVGLTAAATRPTATAASLLPTLAATAAAAVVLLVLIPLVRPPGIAAARAVSYDPVTAFPAAEAEESGAPEGYGAPEESGALEPACAADSGPVEPRRRSFLAAGAATAAIAAGAGLGGQAADRAAEQRGQRAAVRAHPQAGGHHPEPAARRRPGHPWARVVRHVRTTQLLPGGHRAASCRR